MECVKRRYSYRVYPSSRQKRDLARTFGCVRKVYNDTLALHSANYEAGLPRMKSSDAQRFVVTDSRKQHSWMADAPYMALHQSMRDAERAFSNFFSSVNGRRKGPKVGYPKFKSRFSGKQSARFIRNGFRVNGQYVTIAKIGRMKMALSRELPSDPSSVTIIHNSDDTYTVSFVVEVEPVSVEPAVERHAGIDLGLETFATIVYSDGTREKIENPRFAKKAARKLKKAQQSLARKEGPDRKTRTPASNRWKKQKLRVAKQYQHVKNAHQDFARKTAHRLASENSTIAIESLNIRGLARAGGKNAQGRGLRRSIHDASWNTFISALVDKADTRVIKVDPYLTSQTCSICKAVDGPKPLNVREWTCKCGASLDRDYNAALNIMLAGGHSESENARGEDVRLRLAGADLDEARTRRSDTKVTA